MLQALKASGQVGGGKKTGVAAASPFGGGGATKKGHGGHHHHHHHHHNNKNHLHHRKKQKAHHRLIENDLPKDTKQSFAERMFEGFLTILHGIQHLIAQAITCGYCFERYSEKQKIVEPLDPHKTRCQPDTAVFCWLNLLIAVVGLIGYIVTTTFQPLPTFFRVTHFAYGGACSNENFEEKAECLKEGHQWTGECDPTTVIMIEYVPAVGCLKMAKQAVELRKRPEKIDAGEIDEQDDGVQAGAPPINPGSMVITFTEHYMWGLSWYADLYESDDCLSADGVPNSIAKVTGQPPLYPVTQVLDECLDRGEWDYKYKGASLAGSHCLGSGKMRHVMGMFEDRKCTSLVRATAYNLTHFEVVGMSKDSSFKCKGSEDKSPDHEDNINCAKFKCAKSDIDQMYYQVIKVTDACASEFDAQGMLREDNGIYTTEPQCSSELECPNGKGPGAAGGRLEGHRLLLVFVPAAFAAQGLGIM